MTSTEDQARAAMRAIAGTVDDAPPLRLAGAAAGDQGIAALLDKAAYDLAARDEADLDRVARGETSPGETGRNEVLSGGRGARHPIAGRPGPRRPGRAPGSRRPGGAPPLGGPGRDRRRRRWSVLAPVAAAVMIVVVAVALAVIRDIPNGSSATPPTPASSASHASGPADARAGAPEYYVALMQRDSPPYLVVGNTFTGQVIATVKAPAGVFLDYVFGAAGDDREFIVTGETLPGPVVEARWYRLRITPDGSTHALLTPLPDLTRDPPAGAALSPDGTELAVAPQGHPATLRVYSTATGALLREWSTKAPGELMAERIPAGALSSPYAPLVLRWSADGRQLAFAWNATSIRVLDAAAPNGDLIAGSRPLGAIGTSYATLSSYTCHAGQGWQFVTVTRGPAAGQGIVCAGSTQAGRYTACTSPTGTTCAYTQRVSLGFLLATGSGQGGGYLGLLAGSDCTGEQQAGAYIGWANADGSVIIGSQVCGGQRRFGVFRGGTFTPLPALPDSTYLDAGALGGTFAW